MKAPTLVAGMGDPNEEYPRYLVLDARKAIFSVGKDNSIAGDTALPLHKWMLAAATFDGNNFRCGAHDHPRCT